MTRPRSGLMILTLTLGACACGAKGEEIHVAPGEGALAAAASAARAGDILVLERGSYDGQVTLGRGVSIRGAGPESTRITVEQDFAFECPEGGNTIQSLEIRGRDQTQQVGILAAGSVRIERVRFTNLNAGVRLDVAPLSDIVGCEFNMCNIGLWGDNGASPTVWGCRFEKCGLGVFNGEGAPLIRNCFFHSSLAGIQLFLGATGRMPIVRNNLFWQCGRHAIELHQRTDPAQAPSIRNNMFYDCRAIMLSTEQLADRFSHAFVQKVHEPLVRTRRGLKVDVDDEERHIKMGEPRLSMRDDGSLEIGSLQIMRQGVALGSEPGEKNHWLGLEPLWLDPGINAPIASAPGARFDPELDEPIVTNGQIEEEQVLERMGFDLASLERTIDEDEQTAEYPVQFSGREGSSIRFSVSRYLGEAELEPQGPPWWSVRAGGDGRKPDEDGD